MQNREIKIFKFIRRLKICTNSDKLIEFNKEGNYLFFTWGDLDQDINFDNSNTRFFFEKFINRTLNVNLNINIYYQLSNFLFIYFILFKK